MASVQQTVKIMLPDWIASRGLQKEVGLGAVLQTIARSCGRVRELLSREHPEVLKDQNNAFDDEQLTVDVSTDDAIAVCLGHCKNVAAWASEEKPAIVHSPHHQAPNGAGQFFVAYDPLDGSSIIEANWSVGSIFGVWPGDTPVGRPLTDMAASVVAVYGPRCMLFVAVPGCVGAFALGPHGCWQHLKDVGAIAPKAKIFSPGNLRAATELPWYRDLLNEYRDRRATLRYTGGMVPDVTQMFIKGSGIFMTPSAPKSKMKLRVCFECGPMAFMVEQVGGRSTEGELGKSYLTRVVMSTNDRSGLVVGSSEDVDNYCRRKAAGEQQMTTMQSKL
eukprot:PhM_4_TR232/c0_g1_i1/m.47752/K01100/E3.1.3.37; sedoheptulose-bisphosphatase